MCAVLIRRRRPFYGTRDRQQPTVRLAGSISLKLAAHDAALARR